MNIDIRSHRVCLSRRLRASVERRVESVLGRFEHRILEVRVWLIDINGPKGGIDDRCRVDIRCVDGSRFVATATAVDVRNAVDRALRRSRARMVRGYDRVVPFPAQARAMEGADPVGRWLREVSLA